MLHIALSDVICERMMLNLSAIVMLTAGVFSILHTTPEFVICDQLPPPGAGIGFRSRSAPCPCPASASAEEIEEFNCRSLAKCAEGPEE